MTLLLIKPVSAEIKKTCLVKIVVCFSLLLAKGALDSLYKTALITDQYGIIIYVQLPIADLSYF